MLKSFFPIIPLSSLNVRLVLLVRDPRGTLQSRKHRDWCPGRPDCDHPATLCRDMVSDYEAAKELLDAYPDRLKVVRYEDLSLEPFQGAQDILKFYGLPFDRTVEIFLETHTKMDYGGVSSTFRDSKSAPFHWLKDLQYSEVSGGGELRGNYENNSLLFSAFPDPSDPRELHRSNGPVGL